MPVNPSRSNSSVSDTLQKRNFWTRFEKTRNISVLANDSPGHILGPKRRKEWKLNNGLFGFWFLGVKKILINTIDSLNIIVGTNAYAFKGRGPTHWTSLVLMNKSCSFRGRNLTNFIDSNSNLSRPACLCNLIEICVPPKN